MDTKDEMDVGEGAERGSEDTTGTPDDDIDVEAILSRSRPLGFKWRSFSSEPEFVKKLEPLLSIKQGDAVLFRCQYKGFPKPSVRWLKDNADLEDGRRYKLEEDDSWLMLRLEKTDKWDEGTYRCKLENSEGTAITTSYLEVKGEKGKLLSAEPRKTSERSVSLPPNLRTIREQQSLENIEEAVLAATGPSPIHDYIDLMRKSRTFSSAISDHDDFWSDSSGDKDSSYLAPEDDPISAGSSSDNVFGSDDVITDASNLKTDDVLEHGNKDVEMEYQKELNTPEEADPLSLLQDENLEGQDNSPPPQIVPENYIIDDGQFKDETQENLFIDEDSISNPQLFQSNILQDENISDESNTGEQTDKIMEEKTLISEHITPEETIPSANKDSLERMEHEHFAQEANILDSDIPEGNIAETVHVDRDYDETPVNVPGADDIGMPSAESTDKDELSEAASWDVLGQSSSETGPSNSSFEELPPAVDETYLNEPANAVSDTGPVNSLLEGIQQAADETFLTKTDHTVADMGSNNNSFEELVPTDEGALSVSHIGPTDNKSLEEPTSTVDEAFANKLGEITSLTEKLENELSPGHVDTDIPSVDSSDVGVHRMKNIKDSFFSDLPEEGTPPAGEAQAEDNVPLSLSGEATGIDVGNINISKPPVLGGTVSQGDHDISTEIHDHQVAEVSSTDKNLTEKLSLTNEPALVSQEDTISSSLDDIDQFTKQPLIKEQETTHLVDDVEGAFDNVLPPVPTASAAVASDSLLAEDRYSQYDVVPESSDVISSLNDESPTENIISTIKDLVNKEKPPEETPNEPPVEFDLASTPETPKTPKFVQFKFGDEGKTVHDIPRGPRLSELSDRWLYYCPPVGLATCGAYATDMDIGWFIILLSFCSIISFVIQDLLRKD